MSYFTYYCRIVHWATVDCCFCLPPPFCVFFVLQHFSNLLYFCPAGRFFLLPTFFSFFPLFLLLCRAAFSVLILTLRHVTLSSPAHLTHPRSSYTNPSVVPSSRRRPRHTASIICTFVLGLIALIALIPLLGALQPRKLSSGSSLSFRAGAGPSSTAATTGDVSAVSPGVAMTRGGAKNIDQSGQSRVAIGLSEVRCMCLCFSMEKNGPNSAVTCGRFGLSEVG